MANYDAHAAATLLADPNTPAQALADIAAEHPALWGQVAGHPNVYPGLLEWMASQGFVAQPFGVPGPGSASASASASAEPKKRKTGLLVGIGALVAVLAVIAIVLPIVFAGGGSLQSALRNFEKTRSDFYIQIFDTDQFVRHVGEPFPVSGSDREVERWLEKASEKVNPLVLQLSQSVEATRLMFAAGGFASAYTSDNDRQALLGTVSESQLDEAFGSARRGVWESASTGYGENYYSQLDGVTFFAWRDEELPDELPRPGDSFADNEDVVRMLGQLQGLSGAYRFNISQNDYVSDRLSRWSDGRSDKIRLQGLSYGVEQGQPVIRIAYDFGTPERAADNLEFVTDALEQSAESARMNDAESVHVSGSTIIADFEMDVDDLYRYSIWLFELDS